MIACVTYVCDEPNKIILFLEHLLGMCQMSALEDVIGHVFIECESCCIPQNRYVMIPLSVKAPSFGCGSQIFSTHACMLYTFNIHTTTVKPYQVDWRAPFVVLTDDCIAHDSIWRD